MALTYQGIILSASEAENITGKRIAFDVNGYLVDPKLILQHALEDSFQQPIVSIQESTQGYIIVFLEPYGVIQNNPVTGKRMTILKGDAEYIRSTLEMMIAFHPNIDPVKIIESYSFQCSPQDRLYLREWTRDTYGCV